jgi:hypothetical protein
LLAAATKDNGESVLFIKGECRDFSEASIPELYIQCFRFPLPGGV